MEFIEYPKCSTCKKAKKYLDDNKITYTDRSITEHTPTKEELEKYISKYKVEVKRLFNTSGLKYQELNLKEKLESMTDDEKLTLLASNGMLIKRPLLVCDDKILVGFKIKEWDEYFKKEK